MILIESDRFRCSAGIIGHGPGIQHPDLFPAADTAAATASRTHANVRGADYFRDPPTTTDPDNPSTDEGHDDTLNRLKLHGMALALSEQMTHTAAQGLAFEERLALLLDREELHRENRRMTRLLQLAHLKYREAVIEDLDYRSRGGLDRSQLASLASCDWIRANQSVLIHGATGCGKTYLACALAHQACRQGLSALYVRAPRLFEELALCHADGSFRKRLAAIAKVSVLVIDDFAIAPIGPRERNDLLELLDDRVGTRACILTSQLPVSDWHDYIGDPTLADAILDRLVHRSHRIHLQAKESMRKREAARETAKAKARAEA